MKLVSNYLINNLFNQLNEWFFHLLALLRILFVGLQVGDVMRGLQRDNLTASQTVRPSRVGASMADSAPAILSNDMKRYSNSILINKRNRLTTDNDLCFLLVLRCLLITFQSIFDSILFLFFHAGKSTTVRSYRSSTRSIRKESSGSYNFCAKISM